MGRKIEGLCVEERRLHRLAMDCIRDRYEAGPMDDVLAFHNRQHSIGVMNRGDRIARAAGLIDREVTMVRLCGSFHDIRQFWVAKPLSNDSVRRVRLTGVNEVVSAYELVDMLRDSSFAFTGLELGIMASAIIGTTPAWDEKHKTVYQPLVDKQSHPVVHCVALADLGEAGMDPEAFVKGSYALFIEDNPDIERVILSAHVPGDIPGAIRGAYRARLYDWLGTQPDFARGRRDRTSKELSWLGPRQVEVRRKLFNRFGESVQSALREYATASHLDFVPLMRKLVLAAFPGSK